MSRRIHSIEVAGRSDATLGSAFVRVVDLSQRLVTDQFELMQVETKEKLVSAGRRLATKIFAIACLAVGWLALIGAVMVALSGYAPLELRLLAVGALHATIGASVLLMTAGSTTAER